MPSARASATPVPNSAIASAVFMPTLYKHTYPRVNKLASLTMDKVAYIVSGMRYGERLKRAREHAALTQGQLAARVSEIAKPLTISQPAISQLEKGTATGSEFTVQFAVVCGVRPEWLAYGEGAMINTYQADRRIAHVLAVMERMDDAVRDEAVKEVDHLVELATRLRTGTGGE